MALQGTLDTFALPDVLRLLAATKKTGRLRITVAEAAAASGWRPERSSGIEATHAPHVTDAVDALFELLRFEEGAFTFDAEAAHDDPSPPTDVEILIAQAEALLEEWRAIEAVVPSMDAWVTMRATLPGRRGHRRAGALDHPRGRRRGRHGAPRRRRALPRPSCPISRAVKDLVGARAWSRSPTRRRPARCRT